MAHSKMLSTLALCATSVLLLVCAQRAVAVVGPGDPFSCSFDKGDLCQWSTEGKHGVSTWAFGIPENSNIGPLSAPADGKGGTIYINETILANGKHKQVKLSSRVVGKQKEAACFTFWYHMFAGHGTELALYQISARETDGKEDSRELFKHSGRTTVDRWQQVRLSVQLGRKRNQLRFSAALASKEHASVIALGPFDYTQGTCDVLTDANGYCDFEFDECGWTSTGGWKRGARPSTLDDRDHYVRSGPVNSAQVLMAANKEGQSVIVAIVTSPKLQGKREPQCLEFWYTVMGPRGAELRAQIPVDNKTEVIWKKRPTSDWMLARVQLVKSKPFQVTFRAALPAKKRSVVSIDDVAVRPEPCLPSANCEFVEGICGYVNKFRQDVRWLVGAGRLEEPERQPSVPIPQGAFSSFAYLDLSSQDVSESDPVKTVGLLSPFFDIVDDQTMIVLQYFRHGPDIAEANMSVSCHSDDTTKKTQTLYSAELDEVTEWSELTVALKPGSNCQLAVWVTTGGSTNGAMAIHSVKVQQQVTSPPPDERPTTTSSPAIGGSATHCTFDEGTMCGWTSDGGAMTWTLNNPANKVPSYPRFDHTTLAYKGGFIFADNKKSSEKTAVLKSPTLNLNSVDGACFSFWHFAQHKFMGNITVHSGKQILFTTSTRASHRWQHALAQFNGTADRLELEIRASIGRGLIALDDLRITDGPCPQSDFCSWQEESLCLVNQDPGNVVPWVRREASEVGVPDHTLNNLEGYYLYVNTTALESHHPRSRVFLQRREPTEATCVTFWWRGQGSPSQLNVYRFTKETALRDPLLSMSTSSAGDWWNARTVTVTSASPWNLAFEVVAPEREKSQSGVMVDDVEFADGQCPPYNLCTFENECLPWQIPTTEGSDANFEVERAGSFKMLPRDHSTATEDGYYLLYRSSGIKGNRTTLQLREPSRYACSSLWYFVRPMSDGVSLLLQSESLDGKNKEWSKKQFRLSKQSGDAPIQVVSGSERQSFVAIDDILVSEEDCQDTGKLPSPDFKCGGKMVPMDRICDFVPDCKDGSDERRCGDCDFRKDACGWNLDDVRNQGSTTWKVVPVASVQPSPPTRMNGQRDGKYLLLFTNSSGFPKSNRAIIESPKIRNTNKLCTLMFWFYYASNGELVDAELSMTVASYAVTVWSLRTAREMSREKVWNQAVVEVGRYATELSFHFSANKTGEGRSEFAVAGIQYRDCALPTKTRECTVGEFRCGNGVCVEPRDRCNYVDDCGDNTDEEGCGDYRLGCNFDSSFCDWTPLPPQDNVGTPWKLATPSSSLLSGPTRDHTTGTPDGRFIILHSRSFKNAATIVGPTLDPSMPCSITFFYTIQGGSAHQLSLHIRTSKNGPWKQVWIDVDRNQFFHFIVGHSELLASKPYQVAFKGEYRKHGERGYIAIDDVTFSPSCLAYHGELPETPTQQPPSPTAPSELPALPTTTPAPRTQPPFACRENEFQCGSIEECVPLTNVCDFKDHCSNGADEAKCGACEFMRDLCGLENEEPNARFGWTWKATQDAAHSRHFPTADSRNNTYGSYAAYSLINDDMPADRVVNSMITPRLGPIGHSCVVNFYVNTGGMSAVLTFGVLPPSEETTVVLATAYVNKLQSEWTLVSVKTGNWDAGARFSYSTDTVGVSVDRPRYVNCHPDSQSEGAEATAQVSCDFSRPQECGWFPERRTADIAWSVHSDGAHLPSHTWQPSDSASGNGAYMYAENNLRGVKKAHLVSIRMSPTTNLGRCFTFWYNMWHPNSGDLNLLQRVDNVSSSLVWTRSGPQGKEWQEGQVQLVSDEPHQLVFEAVLKPGIPGVIAIDHFTLKDGRCDSGKVCTFESGSCGWELHNWEVTKGRSAVLPPSDHSTWAPSGSFARVLPPNGRMVSPQGWYDATQQRCLRFWFFMAGSAAETLNVTRVTDSVLEESLWFRTADGTTENSWHSAAVNVTGAQGKIATAFEGATSGDPGTAVAVDDISLGAEACPKPGSCSFEEDMCNWHNNKGFKYAQWYRHKGRTILSGGGLDKDHTKGTADGYYLLLDSQDQSDILIGSLQSETLALGPAVCFQLYYYMKSGTQASLNVTFGDASGLASDPPTTVYATGPAEWTLLSVERDNVPGTFSVMITATAGKLAEDVAIDDIDIWAGKCQNALETSTTSQSTIETAASVEPSTTATTDAPVTAIGTTASVEPSTTATTDAPVTAIGTTASVEPSTPSTTGVPETAIGTTVSEEPSRTSTTYAPVTELTTLPTEESTLKTESTTPSSTDSPSETFTTEETTLTTEKTTTPVTEVPSQTSLQCSYGQFSCGDDVTCIPSLLRCDGVKDCPNGHDEDCETENICKESEFYCPSRSPSECLPQAFLCDGYDDCAGGADESLCEVCPEYLCLNGATCSWTREQRSPVCNCSDSYKGSRCQLRATGVQAEQQDKLKAAGSSGTAIVSTVIVLALVAIAVAITVVIIKRRRAAQNPRLLYNAASYDVTTEETAFRD